MYAITEHKSIAILYKLINDVFFDTNVIERPFEKTFYFL